MDYADYYNDYVWGNWTDSQGNIKRIHFKKKWGNHTFTEDEIQKLLDGKIITFQYKKKSIAGHLQYASYQGKEYFGFIPDFDEEYEDKPVYRNEGKHSLFALDLQKENNVMAEYMRLYYYEKLVDYNQTATQNYQRITDFQLQKDGVDVILTQNKKKYIIDEKAQMDYIYSDSPLPTFALELLNSSTGARGWFINEKLKTEYYMFIWPHADKKPLTVDNIEYAYYALVNKKNLLIEVEKKCGKTPQQLFEYAKKISKREIGNKRYYGDGTVKDYEYGYSSSVDGFNRGAYLIYTLSKQERPVNLVVKKKWLEDISDAYGTIQKENK